MIVKELIEQLQKVDGNLIVAGYSSLDEGDFPVDIVRVAEVNEYGIDGCYCQAYSNFSKRDGKPILRDQKMVCVLSQLYDFDDDFDDEEESMIE